MKRAVLVIATVALCGCGDEIHNYYTTTAPTDGGFTNISTVTPPTTPTPPSTDTVTPPTIVGAASFIPSNTFCTANMNAAFAQYSTPESISISQQSSGLNSVSWSYSTKGIFINFLWGGYIEAGVCDQTTNTYVTP